MSPYGATTLPAAPPLGNLQAAPVYSDVPAAPLAPAIPVGPPQPVFAPAVPPTPLAAPAVPLSSVPPAVPVTAALPIGQDHLRISPDRVLAPVGTEVVLKAGICSASGYLLADHRVEWLLNRDGTGQFVDLGERGELDLFRWPWDTPRKVDNWYAIGSTAFAPICLHRGTADPTDDVQIQKGEAWVTVTSPVEGTSSVTAYTPHVASWQFRRATATIYWVDAQWAFPPSVVVEAGRPHVLTTVVSRRTDGTPLPGWIVRYEVTGGAALGYDAGSVAEVATDAAGRASVEVSPVGGAAGATNVVMTLIRPAQASPNLSPQLEIGRGAAQVAWGGAASPPLSPAVPPSPYPTTPSPALPPSSSVPTSPRDSMPPDPYAAPPPGTYTPPRDEPTPAGQPRLETRVTRSGPEEVAVGEFVRFEVTVTNRGDGTARGIVVQSRFDRGLSHPEAAPNEFAVKYPGMSDLPPGQSATVPLTFRVTAAGRQCHEVTVTAQGTAAAAPERACVNAREPAPLAQPVLEVRKTGPPRHFVGEIAKFGTAIRNVGDVAITNIQIVEQLDPALLPLEAESGHERLPDGRILVRVDRLEVGERRVLGLTARCVRPNNSACNSVIVAADGGVNVADESCIEILPPLPPGGATLPGAQPLPPVASSNLQLSFNESPSPMTAGQQATITVSVENTGLQSERQVAVRLLFPPELRPDVNQVRPPGQATLIGQELRFLPIAELPARQRRDLVIPVIVNQPGSVQIQAQLVSAGMSEPTTVQSRVITIQPTTF